MATAPTNLQQQPTLTLSGGLGFKMTVADSVDGLLYMPDTNGDLIVAAANVFCGVPFKRAKVGERVALVVTGVLTLTASGAITSGGPVTVDTGGKVKAATVGTDHVFGFLIGPTCTTDGDIISVLKTS